MPISGTYEWTERKDQLKIKIPLKGVSPKLVDIFVTPTLLKVNFAPYLVEILLKYEVDAIKHKATVKDNVLNIILFKKIIGKWNVLEASIDSNHDFNMNVVGNDVDVGQEVVETTTEGSDNIIDASATSITVSSHTTTPTTTNHKNKSKKEIIADKKREALLSQSKVEEEMDERRKDRRLADEKFSLRNQMAIESGERDRLDNIKADQKRQEETAMHEALSKLRDDELRNSSSSSSSSSSKNKKSWS